jgi:hypothetical protein
MSRRNHRSLLSPSFPRRRDFFLVPRSSFLENPRDHLIQRQASDAHVRQRVPIQNVRQYLSDMGAIQFQFRRLPDDAHFAGTAE